MGANSLIKCSALMDQFVPDIDPAVYVKRIAPCTAILNSRPVATCRFFQYTFALRPRLTSQQEDIMARGNHSIRDALLVSGVLLVSGRAMAADVTPERLLNPDKEPQNWLMNHRTYNGQRYAPLARINRDNVKNLKLAYAVPLGGGAGNEYSVATPLAEDGFLYVTDSWGVLYKIDGASGDVGRVVWRMDPKQEAARSKDAFEHS
jgi:glucose dehydrogenase